MSREDINQLAAFSNGQRIRRLWAYGRRVPPASRSSDLSRHGSFCQFVVERTGLMLTVALACAFFPSRCILAVIAAVLLMFRNRAMALRVCTLLFVCHSGYPLLHKANRADGLDLAGFLPELQLKNVAMSFDSRPTRTLGKLGSTDAPSHYSWNATQNLVNCEQYAHRFAICDSSTIRPAPPATVVHRSAVATPESSRNAFAPRVSGRP